MVVFSLAMRRVFAIALFALLIGCGVPVQHGLDERSANEVVTALDRAGIRAEKLAGEGTGETPTYIVKVAASESSRAMELMQSLGLPRTQRSGLAETYGQPSLVPSPTEEKARFIDALENDIERTLETIEGVVSARVHLTLAENDPLSVDAKPRTPAQASVLLKVRPDAKLGIETLEFQRLIAGTVPGLDPVKVSVVSTAAPEWTGINGPMLISVGPLSMTPASKTVLAGAFAAVLGIVAILALLLLLTARRLAAVQRDRRAI